MDEQFKKAKRHALRLLHHNMAIVSAGTAPEILGTLVTWFMQTSFEPPLVTLALKKDSRLLELVEETGRLTISLIAKNDEQLAKAFFTPGQWESDGTCKGFPAQVLPEGGMIFQASPAWLVGEVAQIIRIGDHYPVISRIVKAGINSTDTPAMCLCETPWHYGG